MYNRLSSSGGLGNMDMSQLLWSEQAERAQLTVLTSRTPRSSLTGEIA